MDGRVPQGRCGKACGGGTAGGSAAWRVASPRWRMAADGSTLAALLLPQVLADCAGAFVLTGWITASATALLLVSWLVDSVRRPTHLALPACRPSHPPPGLRPRAGRAS